MIYLQPELRPAVKAGSRRRAESRRLVASPPTVRDNTVTTNAAGEAVITEMRRLGPE
jgi:hypothetical protein